MKFIKNFFKHDEIIVGLTGLRKKEDYIKVTMPDNYKRTFLNIPKDNYLL